MLHGFEAGWVHAMLVKINGKDYRSQFQMEMVLYLELVISRIDFKIRTIELDRKRIKLHILLGKRGASEEDEALQDVR
ncbi:hypothetical protein PVK06_025088 [Gossypium arboreum]|uniref:Uncharacterized protein n=1 Tax=Gossypium arboreum TaxID=29729 RepID=A0ABR0PFN4_GOSAR|nr:hypothetical protein PVK06_025088 [Gossypium arboreum]